MSARDVLLMDWGKQDTAAPGRVRALLRGRLQDEYGIATLGDLADLEAVWLYKLKNCSRGTVRKLQESLARAGVAATWCGPQRRPGAR